MKDVRCRRNRYSTLLFRYDHRGLWLYCKDCLSQTQNKKGAQHLIPWSAILGLMMRFIFNIEPTALPEGISDGFGDTDPDSFNSES